MLRRIAEAIDPRADGQRRRRALLVIAAEDFAAQLTAKKGSRGGSGYGGWDLSNMAQAAFWAMLLLSQRRERFTMRLLGQIHRDTAAVPPYTAEKRATREILTAVPGIDADSLVGFVDVAIVQFRPPQSSGTPLVPRAEAVELLKAAALRGAMVGELRPEAARAAWLATQEDPTADAEGQWKRAQGRAETLLRRWEAARKGQKRPLI